MSTRQVRPYKWLATLAGFAISAMHVAAQVVVENTQYGQSPSGSLTWTNRFDVGGDGANRTLVVVATVEIGSVGSQADFTNVTYAGQTLTKALDFTGIAPNDHPVEVFYLDNPPTGTADLVIDVDVADQFGYTAYSLQNVTPGGPGIATQKVFATLPVDADKSVSIDVTTTSSNTFLIATLNDNNNNGSNPTHPANYTAVSSFNSGSCMVRSGYLLDENPGLNTFTWKNVVGGRPNIAVVGFGSEVLTAEDRIAGATARIEALFQADKGKAFVPAKVLAPLDTGRCYYSRAYSWSVAGFAARCFYLDEMLPEANAALIQNGKYYLRELTAQEEASILDPDAGTEGNTAPYARITSRDTVHWHADIILRLIDMYGSKGSVAAGRMSADAEAMSLEYISHYVKLVGKLTKAEYVQSKTWDSYESENHHAMDFRTHWHFSKIAKDHPDYQDFTTASGATPAQLYEAYNQYFIEYARERFRKGLFAEMMNRGYNSATYSGFYNFYDFGTPEVKEHARMLLDLFWAYYAQEQFNDVVGGGATRIDFDAGFTAGHAGTTSALAWSYFGMVGAPSGVDGRSINPYFSSYRPPAVVADIATDIAGRGTYEIRQTAQGLGTTGSTNPDVSLATTPHRLRTDGGGIVRYSYCNPAFIMGLPMLEARPKSDWVGYSCQSRWQGVVFSADRANEMARIVPAVLPIDGEDTFNPHWGVQSKGSMITQMLNTHSGGKEMWVFISKAGLNSNPVIENNIVFVDIADAYAAIRVVGTTYSLDEDYNANIRPHFVVRLTDKLKPVILEVMAKTVEPDFEAFKQLVQSNTPVFSSGLVTYKTIYGDDLTFDANYNNKPTINGVTVDYSPPKSYESPFLHGDYNGETFVIEKGSRQEIYSLSAPLLRTLSPADNATNVLVSANLVATFDEPVQPGTGSLVLKKSSDDSTVQTFDVTTDVVFDGSHITIDPSGMLESTTGYHVTIDATAVQDLAGNPYAGLSASTDWNFTTVTAGAIVPVNTGSKVVSSSLANSSTTLSFDAGADADMLIVAVSTERSSEAMYAVSYAGEPLSQAVESVQAGIWYLDLTSTAYSGGAADLVVDFAGITTVNGVGIGAVSVAAGGQSIQLHTTAIGAAGADSVLLATTRSNTFNVASFNANSTGTVSVDAPLFPIYANGNIGSARGAAGYERRVAAGNHTYSWTTGDPRRVVAAAFYIGNTFADWISAYSLGGLNNLADDPDGDRIPNAIEALFGTHPGEMSDGLGNLATDTTTTTFTHPMNENPPADLRLFYQWSTNLVGWYECNGIDGPPGGKTVSVSTATVNTNATVTAEASEPLDCLFIRIGSIHEQ